MVTYAMLFEGLKCPLCDYSNGIKEFMKLAIEEELLNNIGT